jgi:hypothetical protein
MGPLRRLSQGDSGPSVVLLPSVSNFHVDPQNRKGPPPPFLPLYPSNVHSARKPPLNQAPSSEGKGSATMEEKPLGEQSQLGFD